MLKKWEDTGKDEIALVVPTPDTLLLTSLNFNPIMDK